MNLTELLTSIADAIRAKTGSTAKINAQNFPTAISNITTSTGNASTGDVLSGKTFSNDSGTGLTGTMTDRTKSSITYTSSNSVPVQVADAIFMNTNSDGTKRVSFRTNGISGYYDNNTLVSRPASDFGSASASQVLSGATFTSSNGLHATGTMTDRTKSSIRTVDYGTPIHVCDAVFMSTNSDGVKRVLFRTGNISGYYDNNTLIGCAADRFGTASSAQVLSGATFTSSNGLKITGTMPNVTYSLSGTTLTITES